MKESTREALNMYFEFLLSLVIITIAGLLIYKGIASEFACGLMTLVTGFWFTKRSNESAVNNLLKQSPVNVITTPSQQTQTTPPGGDIPNGN